MRGHIFAVRNYLLTNKIVLKTKKDDLPISWGVVNAEKRRNPEEDGAEPINIEEVIKMTQALDKIVKLTFLQKLAWKVIFTLAFFGLKRISEYANDLKKKVQLYVEQIQLEFGLASEQWESSTWFTLNRRKGKTAQFGKDLYATYVCTDQEGLCAVCTMKEYLKERLKTERKKILLKDVLFPGGRAFNKYQVGTTLKKVAKLTKLEIVAKSHGLRKGGTQHAVEVGIPKEAINKLADTRNPQWIERYYRNIRRKQQVRIIKKAYKQKFDTE